jgi:hypothetical protein
MLVYFVLGEVDFGFLVNCQIDGEGDDGSEGGDGGAGEEASDSFCFEDLPAWMGAAVLRVMECPNL